MKSVNLNLVVRIIKDSKKHDLYELHTIYRLTPVEAREAVSTLEKMGILTTDANIFEISEKIKNESISLLYKQIHHRKVELDKEKIAEIKKNAVDSGGMYFPNFRIIDRYLKAD